MPDGTHRITGPQKFYLFLLRATGWLGLMVVPIYAFAWTADALHPEFPIIFVGIMGFFGLLSCLLFAGVSDQPTYLLRPTSFLKGVVVYLVAGFLNGLIMMQVVVMMMSIRIDLFAPGFEVWALGALQNLDPRFASVSQMSAKAQLEGMPIAFMGSLIIGSIAGAIATLPASFASLMALFLRFSSRGPGRSEVERRASRAMANDAAQQEKARALRAMRMRRAKQRTA